MNDSITTISGPFYEITTQSDSCRSTEHPRFLVEQGEGAFASVVFKTKAAALDYLKSTIPDGVDVWEYAGARVRKADAWLRILRTSDDHWFDLYPTTAGYDAWEANRSGYSDSDVITRS